MSTAQIAVSTAKFKSPKPDLLRPKSVTAQDKAIGQRLRALRLSLDMTQEGVAEKLGKTFQQLQKYEKGINRVPPGSLTILCEVYGTTPDFILLGKGSGPDTPESHLIAIFMKATAVHGKKLTDFLQLATTMRKENFAALFDLVKAWK